MQLDKNRYFVLASTQLFPFSTPATLPATTDDAALILARSAFEHVQGGQLQEALSRYTQGIEDYPEQAFFHACRSLLNEHLGDGEGAFYDYQVAKSIDFNYHIYLEWRENRPDIAAIDPAVGFTDLQSLLETALESTQQFDYEHALSLYSEGLAAFEASADLFVFRGALHMRLLQYDLAIADFEAALAIEPMHVQAQLSLAKFYEAIHAPEHAREAFNKAVTLSPENSVIYEERGNFFVEQNAYIEALADYTTLVSLLPDDFYIYAMRADLLSKMEKWADALSDYSKAIQLNPYYSDLYTYRAEVKEKLGDLDGAAADRRMFEEIEAED